MKPQFKQLKQLRQELEETIIMLPTTIDAIRAILKADPSLTPADRSRIIAVLRNHGKSDKSDKKDALPQELRIMRRQEVAELFGRSLWFVDELAASGILSKVTLPTRKRAVGFRSSDVEELIAGQ